MTEKQNSNIAWHKGDFHSKATVQDILLYMHEIFFSLGRDMVYYGL
jgi:hypothetical protein